jgi:hypothetical protein
MVDELLAFIAVSDIQAEASAKILPKGAGSFGLFKSRPEWSRLDENRRQCAALKAGAGKT